MKFPVLSLLNRESFVEVDCSVPDSSESRIIDELCFPDIDKLFGHLGMRWDDYSVRVECGRQPNKGRGCGSGTSIG